ncbi:MAG: hypothetical protein ACE3JN_11275 [Ectobacillus sp.]
MDSFVDWNERRRLQREKRLEPARGKRPPVVENQQSSFFIKMSAALFARRSYF